MPNGEPTVTDTQLHAYKNFLLYVMYQCALNHILEHVPQEFKNNIHAYR